MIKSNAGWLGNTAEHFDVIDSTNTYLKRDARNFPHGHVVTACLQTAGKGRMGRGWQAGSGSCLLLSFLLRSWPLNCLSALPLLIGLGVSRAVEAYVPVSTALKWSNDILIEGRKLSGILCESIVTTSCADIICGIGVNLRQTREEFDGLSLVYATSLLLETGKGPDGDVLKGIILRELEPMLDGFREGGFASYLDEYKSRCVTLGAQVRLIGSERGAGEDAVAEDIAVTGELICRDGDGRVFHVPAGDVSVKGVYGYVR